MSDLKMQIVVRFDPATAEFSLDGCDKNPVVALGMLDYALARVRGFLTRVDLAEQMKNAPRVQVVPRLVE
jgi:hypothetical protein